MITVPPVIPTGSACDDSFSSNGYSATWVYDLDTNKIEFTISATLSTDKWLAIGFNSEKLMVMLF